MTKEKTTHEVPSDPVVVKTSKSVKPKALEVDAPLISSEVDSTVTPPNMPGSYLTVDSRMDSSTITVKFRAKEAPELVLEDLVDSSGEAGARKIDIPLDYLTPLMGFTALISYEGKSQGQAATSSVKEVGISFYSASESEALAPYLLHEKNVNNTPTYDMHDHPDDETVLVPVPPLAKAGDRVYCTAATEQEALKHVFYTVTNGHELTPEEATPGYILQFPIARGWLARRKPWRSLTLQCGWLTSKLAAKPPAPVPPHLETLLPENALEIQKRRTAAFIVDNVLKNLPPPHLRQSVPYNEEWCLNPELTKGGGDIDAANLDTYAQDKVCFYASGVGYGPEPLGCVTIDEGGELASAKLPSCVVACFFNKPMTLSYTIQFPNSEAVQSSPERVVNVMAPLLSAAEIEDATLATLDLNTFAGDATAFVPVWGYAACSECCWMWITGEDEDGNDHRIDILMGAPVTDDWKMHGVDTPILREALQELADCSDFKLHFAASFCGVTDRAQAIDAPTTTFNITQEDLQLGKPKVVQAVEDDLEPYNGREGVDVVVDFQRMSHRQEISLCWLKKDGSCWPVVPKPGTRPGPVNFPLPREAVIEAIGTTVTINYTVSSACKLATSEDLRLKVGIPHRLPTPVVRQAVPVATQDGILSLGTFVGNADIEVEKWWFILLGQKAWMRGVGTRQNGSPYAFNVYLAKAVTNVSEGMKDIVPRSHLAVLKHGSRLTFTFNSTPDGGASESNTVIFPSLSLIFQSSYYDFTPFSNGRNGWLDGPASQGENQLSYQLGKYCIANGTLSSGSSGVVLYKNFTGLEVGRSYRFSMLGCSYNGAAPLPVLALVVNGNYLASSTFSMSWKKIEGTFVATGSSMVLQVHTLVASGADGNDFGMTELKVEHL
ncbi:hypothetical protein MJP36_11280 [Pseudomonas palleroniana]|uniref:hypothetical protein n=1 Tax=Pseudomonas palleroniana TaxID=191390 RepID=UPI001FCBE24D|nr:hypothetical protein [Pseudomonas palleroniana]UOK40397.1 hypothetical protein MJP36_11280 [Pseudomonas palleroniana]